MSSSNPSDKKQPELSPAQRRASRRTMLAMVFLFVTPVVLAYIAQQMDWFNTATRHNGTLMESPYPQFEQFDWQDAQGEDLHFKDFETQWWWVYLPAANECDAHCELNMEFLTRSHSGLAKKAEKLTRLVVFPSEVVYQDRVKNQEQLRLAKGSSNALERDKIYAMDVHGNIFMQYDTVKDLEEATERSKGLRDDMRHAMKMTGK